MGGLAPDAFLIDVLSGLSRAQKAIPPRWLYDQTGSELFELITELPEYYVTRVEVGLLEEIAAEFAAEIGPEATIVEYGAGAAIKVRLLLDALERPAEFVAIDISYDHLRDAVNGIAVHYPDLAVRAIESDFLAGAIKADIPEGRTRVGFLAGSTIGNLSDDDIGAFLQSARALLGPGAFMVLGADLRKSPDILIPAYDDAAGVTARFNKNLLTRINRELRGTISPDKFAHRAVWADELSQIEMHLESLTDQEFSIAGQTFSMARGETIHTEFSRKFRRDELEKLMGQNDWCVSKYATDPKQYFALMLLKTA